MTVSSEDGEQNPVFKLKSCACPRTACYLHFFPREYTKTTPWLSHKSSGGRCSEKKSIWWGQLLFSLVHPHKVKHGGDDTLPGTVTTRVTHSFDKSNSDLCNKRGKKSKLPKVCRDSSGLLPWRRYSGWALRHRDTDPCTNFWWCLLPHQ